MYCSSFGLIAPSLTARFFVHQSDDMVFGDETRIFQCSPMTTCEATNMRTEVTATSRQGVTATRSHRHSLASFRFGLDFTAGEGSPPSKSGLG